MDNSTATTIRPGRQERELRRFRRALARAGVVVEHEAAAPKTLRSLTATQTASMYGKYPRCPRCRGGQRD